MARLALGAALAYPLLLALLFVARPLWLPLVARGARDLLVLSSWVPPIWDVRFESDSRFRVWTPLAGRAHAGSAPWAAFTLLFPLGFALAAPGIAPAERLWRGGVVVAGGLAVQGFLLAANSAYALDGSMTELGLALYPAWRARVHEQLAFWTWSLGAILFPLAASLYVLAPVIPGLGRGRSAGGRSAGGRNAGARPLRLRALAAALVGVGLLAADVAASSRLARTDVDALASALDVFNPDPGGYYVAEAERALAAGDLETAQRHFGLALRYSQHTARARRGLEELGRRAEPGGKGP